MKRSIALLTIAAALCFASALCGFSQAAPAKGRVIVPESSIPVRGRVNTNLLIFVPEGQPMAQPAPPPGANTPASLACVYHLVKQVKGCPISGTTNVPTGGAKAIALVGWGGNSATIENDLKTFDKQFGVADPPSFEEVCVGSGGCSPQGSWSLEEALDVEWAHAMAPKAKIYLVELADDDSNIFDAEAKASSLVAAAGGGEVSNSWGSYEFSGENKNDSYFKTKGIVYFASSGDQGGITVYPGASPFVVSAGGTSINRNGSGDFSGESAWGDGVKGDVGAGGGPSAYEPRPSYQSIIKSIVGSHRGTPDISFDADPFTGVAVYSTPWGGWVEVGGTSVSSPSLAGIVNASDEFKTSTNAELTETYNEYGNATKYKADFRDITTGSNGFACVKGWDFCSGIGSPITYKGK